MNGETASTVTLNTDGTLTITYQFPKTDGTPIAAVEVTGIDAPSANTALDTAAATSTGNVTLSAVTWTDNDTTAAYAKEYTATVTATAATDYAFTNTTTAKVNGEKASTVTLNTDGTLTITYKFPKTALEPVDIGHADKTAGYSSTPVDIPVEGMFTIPAEAGAASYAVTNVSGTGDFNNTTNKLTVTAVGTFTVTVNTAATDTHAAGTASATLTVTQKNAAAENSGVTAAQAKGESLTYDGQPKTPTLTVKDGDKSLTSGTDYTVEYMGVAPTSYTQSGTAPTDAGTYNAVVKFKGNYTGEKTVEFTIGKLDISDFTVAPAAASVAYTGAALTPGVAENGVSKKIGETSFTVPTADYSGEGGIAYANNTNATTETSKAKVTVTIINTSSNFTGSASGTFAITPLTMAADPANPAVGDYRIAVTSTPASKPYTGNENKPDSVTVTLQQCTAADGANSTWTDGKALTNGTDYEFAYAPGEVTGVGDYAINVTLKGNYSGSGTGRYAITKATETADSVTADQKPTAKADADALTYTGAPQTLVNAPQSPNTSYTIQYQVDDSTAWVAEPQATAAGDHTVRYRFVSDNYNDITSDDFTLTVNIARKEVSLTWPADVSFPYDGAEHSVTAVLGDKAKEADEVTVEYANTGTDVAAATDAGSYTAKATGLAGAAAGNYTLPANATQAWSITPASLTVTAKPRTITYGDAPANDGVTYSGFVGNDSETSNDLTGTLTYTYDGYARYGSKGTYADCITPAGLSSGNYTITYEKGTLTVNAKPVTFTWPDDAGSTFAYDGTPRSVTAEADTVNGDSLTLVYQDNEKTAKGDYTARVTGISGNDNYVLEENTASASHTWHITQADNAISAINNLDASWTYDRTARAISVTATFGADKAVYEYYRKGEGDSWTSLGNTQPTAAGDYKVAATIPATDDYKAASREQTFTIAPRDASGATVTMDPAADLTYSGSQLTPDITLSQVVTGEDLVKGTDYEVTYGENTNAGTDAGTVTVAFKGNYSGQIVKTFTIAQAANAITADTSITGWTYGETASAPAAATATFGTPEYVYYASDGTTVLNAAPTDAGSYYVQAVVTETANYTGVQGDKKPFTISQRSVTVSGITADEKTYNGDTAAALVLTGATFANKLVNDVLSLDPAHTAGTFADAGVANDKTVTITYDTSNGLSLAGASAANYVLDKVNSQQSTTANIIKATETADSVTDAQKPTAKADADALTYNGAPQTLVNAPQSPNTNYTILYQVDDSTAWVADPQATAAGDHTVRYKYVSDNYNDITSDDFILTVNIARKEVSLTWPAAVSFPYDGAEHSVTAVLGDKAKEADEVTVEYANTGTNVAAAANAGSYTAKATGLAGAAAGNYTLPANTTQAWSITQAINAITADTSITGWTYGETASAPAAATATFGTPEYVYYASDGTTVLNAAPTDAGSYYVQAVVTETANYTGVQGDKKPFTISQRSVTVSGITADEKTYNGDTAAALVLTGATFANKLVNDVLSLDPAHTAGTFADAGVANDKPVTITYDTGSGLSLAGASAANYVLDKINSQQSTTGSITEAPTPVDFDPAAAENTDQRPSASSGLVYNGAEQALVAKPAADLPYGYSVEYSTDGGQNWSSDIPQGKDAFASGSKSIQYRYVSPNYADITNESFVVTSAEIARRPVTVSGLTADDRAYNGETGVTIRTDGATIGGVDGNTESGIVTGENLTVASASGQMDDASVGDAKFVTVTVTLGGAAAANYEVRPVAGVTVNIGKAEVPYTDAQTASFAPTARNVIYNGSDQPLVTAADAAPGEYGYGAIRYSLDGRNWSGDIPQGKDAGDYTVFYKYESPSCKDIAGTVNGFVGRLDIANATVTPASASAAYNGAALTPGVTGVTVRAGDATLTVPAADYSGEGGIAYANNTDVTTETGKATVTVTITNAGSSFTGSATGTFAITPLTMAADLANPAVGDDRIIVTPTPASKPYTGNENKPDSVTVTLQQCTAADGANSTWTDGIILTNGTDYEFAYAPGEVNGAGDYAINVTLKGNYSGTGTGSYTITRADATTAGKVPETPDPALAGNPLTYDSGKKLSDISLPEGWSWTSPDTVPTVVNDGYEAVYPVDDTNYDWTGVEGYDPADHQLKVKVPVTVNKAEVDPPVIDGKAYTGETQTADVPASGQYTVTTNNGGRDAGSCDVVLTLTDPANYQWTTGDDDGDGTITLPFTITQKDASAEDSGVSAVQTQGETLTYTGEGQAPKLEVKDGDSELDPSNYTVTYQSSDGSPVDGQPAGAGDYKAVITFQDNYTGEITVDFSIGKAEVDPPEISSKPYNEQPQAADVSDTVYYKVSENNGGTNVGEYNVVLTLMDQNNFRWKTGDEDNDGTITLIFTITRVKVSETADLIPAMPDPAPASDPVTYDPGQKLSDISLPEGWSWTNPDTVPTVVNDGYEAVYPVDDTKYDWTGVDGYDPENHQLKVTVPVTVNKAEVDPPVIDGKPYTGETQTADVPASNQYTVTNNGGKDVGSYDVVLTLTDPANCKWKTGDEDGDGTITLPFQITKILVDPPEILRKSYNEQPQAADISDTVDYKVIENNGGTKAGNYDVVLTLMDPANCKWKTGDEDGDGTITLPFQITKAPVDPPGIPSAIYNGEIQAANVPESSLYKVIKNDGGTDPGYYPVVLELTDKENYQWRPSSWVQEDGTICFLTFIIMKDVPVTPAPASLLQNEPVHVDVGNGLPKDGPVIHQWTRGPSLPVLFDADDSSLSSVPDANGTVVFVTEDGYPLYPIPGANGSSYTVTENDLNCYLARVTYEDGHLLESDHIIARSELLGPVVEGRVTFNSNGGSAVASVTGLKYGDKLTKPEDPTRTGYQFAGWYRDEELTQPWDFDNDTVTEAIITLYAKWTQDSGGGGGGGGGGGSGGSPITCSITVKDAENGTVSADKKTAAVNTKVTVKADPMDGYQLKTLTVADSAGSLVSLTENADGTRSFTMPARNVTVSAVFTERASGGDGQPDQPAQKVDFEDVKEDDWFYPYVQYVVENGLMNGMGENRFGPNIALSRAMLVTTLYRQTGSPAVTGDMPFTDVPAGQWYTDAILWAARSEIVNGYGKGRFGPNDLLTREQMAAIMQRYAGLQGKDVSKEADLSGYTDAGTISGWALEGMRWANAAGLITGRTETTLVPRGNVTRAETAAILSRYNEMK